MTRGFLFIGCLLSSIITCATTRQDTIARQPSDAIACISVHTSMNVGKILPDGKVDATYPGTNTAIYPLQSPVLGAKIAIDIRPSRFVKGLYDWNDATIGVALDYLHLGNKEWLGSIIAPYTYLSIPLVRLPHFQLGVRPGIGLAFSTKTYYNTISPDQRNEVLAFIGSHELGFQTIANQCVGSTTNYYFAEALYMEFPIKKGFSIVTSGGWYHVSNGSMVQPNSGYNMLNAEVGLRYTPIERNRIDDQTYAILSPILDSVSYKQTHRIGPRKLSYDGGWDFEASISGGFRQVYYKDQATFGVGAISLATHYRPWAIFKIGGGVDVFYDGAYQLRDTCFGKTALRLAQPADSWRLGVSLQPEFVVGKFTAGFHIGIYLLDGVKELEAEDGSHEYYTLWPNKDPKNKDLDAASLPTAERLKKPIFYPYDILKAGSAGSPDGWLYTRILLKYRPTEHFFIQLGMKAHLTKVEFVDAGIGFALGD